MYLRALSSSLDKPMIFAYFTVVMETSQPENKVKIFEKASSRQRLIAGLILLAVLAMFAAFWLDGRGKIDIGLWFGPCGLKQRYSLPCPTCGMTTSARAFAQGRIFQAFYIQPAGALLSCILVIVALSAFHTAVFGVYFAFLRRFFREVKTRYIILALIVIIVAGWLVTLARAMAVNNTA